MNPWFLWKYSESYFEGKLDETRYGHKRVWSVAKMQLRLSAEGFQMNLTVVKVSEEFVGILSALVKATFWRLFSVVWVAIFYVLIVNINSVLYIYAQIWQRHKLKDKTQRIFRFLFETLYLFHERANSDVVNCNDYKSWLASPRKRIDLKWFEDI